MGLCKGRVAQIILETAERGWRLAIYRSLSRSTFDKPKTCGIVCAYSAIRLLRVGHPRSVALERNSLEMLTLPGETLLFFEQCFFMEPDSNPGAVPGQPPARFPALRPSVAIQRAAPPAMPARSRNANSL